MQIRPACLIQPVLFIADLARTGDIGLLARIAQSRQLKCGASEPGAAAAGLQ
jgi:hypothetical protein